MAISLGFGILFATMITLVLIPVNITIGDDIRHFFRHRYDDLRTAVSVQDSH